MKLLNLLLGIKSVCLIFILFMENGGLIEGQNTTTVVCQGYGRILNRTDPTCHSYILCIPNGTDSYTMWNLKCVNGLVFRETTRTCVTTAMYTCPLGE